MNQYLVSLDETLPFVWLKGDWKVKMCILVTFQIFQLTSVDWMANYIHVHCILNSYACKQQLGHWGSDVNQRRVITPNEITGVKI